MLVFRAQHVGPDADGEIAGVHPVDLRVLADHVEHGHQMLEQQVVGPRELVCNTGTEVGKAGFRGGSWPI